MRRVFVVGPSGGGKTAVCAALALELQDEGRRVAYFKPVGFAGDGREDEDAVLMRGLLGMQVPMKRMVPFSSSPLYLSRHEGRGSYQEQVLEAFEEITLGAEVAIIESAPSPYHLASVGLHAAGIVQLLNPLVLNVHRVINDISVDLAIHYHDYLKACAANSMGVILNQVPRTLLDKARGVYRQVLEEKGFEVLGIIPQRLEIALPTVHEFAEMLEAEVLAGEDKLDNVVEDIIVGAMALESALRYFRRAPNKALITGGDRADLVLAAMETNTSALILTGNLYPEVRIVARAEEKGIPVLLTQYDTFTAIELLRSISRKIRPGDQRTLQIVRENFRQGCNYREIIERICGLT